MRFAVSITFTRDSIEKINIRTYLAVVSARSEPDAYEAAYRRFEDNFPGFTFLSRIIIDIDDTESADVMAENPVEVQFVTDDNHCDCLEDHGFFDEDFLLKCQYCKKIYIYGRFDT